MLNRGDQSSISYHYATTIEWDWIDVCTVFCSANRYNVNTCGIPQKKNKQIGSSTTTRRAQSLFLFIISIDPSAIHQRQKKQNPCCCMNMFMDESPRNVFIYETEAHLWRRERETTMFCFVLLPDNVHSSSSSEKCAFMYPPIREN